MNDYDSRVLREDLRQIAEKKSDEVDLLRRDVDRLENTNRQLSACIDGLRCTCESLLQRVEILERLAAQQQFL